MGNNDQAGGPVMKTAPAFEDTVKTNLVALFPAKYKMQGKMREKDGSTRDMTNDEYIKMSTRSASKYISAWETANNSTLSDAQKAAVYFATTILGAGNGKKFAEKHLKDPGKLAEEFDAFMKSIKIGEIGRGYTGSNFKLFVSNVVPGGNVGQVGSGAPKVKAPKTGDGEGQQTAAAPATANTTAPPTVATESEIAQARAVLNSYVGDGVIVENGKGGYELSAKALPIIREIEVEKNTIETTRLARALANPDAEAKYMLGRGDKMLAQIGRQMEAAEVPPAANERETGNAAPVTAGKGAKLGITTWKPEHYEGMARVSKKTVAPTVEQGTEQQSSRSEPVAPQVQERVQEATENRAVTVGDDEVPENAHAGATVALKASEVKDEAQFKSWIEMQFKDEQITKDWIIKNSGSMYEDFKSVMSDPDMKNESKPDEIARGYIGIAAMAKMQ